jgi:hypothetical protein
MLEGQQRLANAKPLPADQVSVQKANRAALALTVPGLHDDAVDA